MEEALILEFESRFAGKVFLTLTDLTQLLECSEKVIYNWTKRADASRRPPRIVVGKSIRFPKREFARWLAAEQGSKG